MEGQIHMDRAVKSTSARHSVDSLVTQIYKSLVLRMLRIANGIVVVLAGGLTINKYFDCLAGLWRGPRWERARIRENNYILHKIASILFSLPTSSRDRALGYFPNWSRNSSAFGICKGAKGSMLGRRCLRRGRPFSPLTELLYPVSNS